MRRNRKICEQDQLPNEKELNRIAKKAEEEDGRKEGGTKRL